MNKAPTAQVPGAKTAAKEIEPEQEVVRVPPLIAKISKCPRSLHDLWREYQFGPGVFKTAKDFADSKRGVDKCKYYQRNVIGRKFDDMILTGLSADEACDLIYHFYGPSFSVTVMLNKMISDKKTGGSSRADDPSEVISLVVKFVS
jgi:hypothetical protein